MGKVGDLKIINLEGFNWDEGNKYKNWERHRISFKECEEVFFNKPLLLNRDIKHSKQEQRHQCLGKTNKGQLLFISFTMRNNKIRVISARRQGKKERNQYEKTK